MQNFYPLGHLTLLPYLLLPEAYLVLFGVCVA